MPNKIEIKKRESYGRTLYDPVDEGAKLICALLNSKTVPESQFSTLRRFGVEIVIS